MKGYKHKSILWQAILISNEALKYIYQITISHQGGVEESCKDSAKWQTFNLKGLQSISGDDNFGMVRAVLAGNTCCGRLSGTSGLKKPPHKM